MTNTHRITVVGLGPGDASLLTVEARDVLGSAHEVWLRTARHPTAAGLPAGPRYESFDDLYESLGTFDAVYDAIVARLLELARRPDGVVYAVPGHPLVGEATVRGLIERAPVEGLEVQILPGISFVDTAIVALGLDPLAEGLLVLDALALGDHRRMLVPERPTLVAQLYDQRAATHAKLALLESYPPGHPVRLLRATGTTEASVEEVPLAELDRSPALDHLTALYLPRVPLTLDVRSFEGLRAIIARLRAPEGGCPWDLEQTHETLKRFLLEEAYEALDALDEGEPARMAEELGDLLMQVVLQAQVAEDSDEFVIEDVLGAIAAKLVRRHPHVFGDVNVEGASDVIRNWDALKKEERGEQPLLDAVPRAMPALAQAQAVQSRAAKAGFAPPAPADNRPFEPDTLDDLGDLLFAIVEHARERDLDAEEALRLAVRRFRDRVGELERGGEASSRQP